MSEPVVLYEEKGFREVIRERDAPDGDYGERPKKA
jgi:hypothetical protein